MESDRGFTGAIVDMVAGLIKFCLDEMTVEAVVVRASDLRSGVRFSWAVGDEIFIGVVGGAG